MGIEEFKQEVEKFRERLNYEKRILEELMKETKVEEAQFTFRYDWWDRDLQFIQYIKLRHGSSYTYLVHENKRDDVFSVTFCVSGVDVCKLTVKNASFQSSLH